MIYKANEKRYGEMKYNRCGNSGLMLPKISIGLWHNFGENSLYSNMKDICFSSFDNGITHFDIANNYGPPGGEAEKNFGRILKEEMHSYRDEMIITTKAGHFMWEGPYGDWGSKKYLIASINQSLKMLKLDYVDIFYHHRMDTNTPLEESMLALDQIVKSGKALYVGLSNYDGETCKKAYSILKELKCPFIINQNKYSLFERAIETNKLKNTSKELGLGVIAFSPLAQGLLTDRYLNGIPADSRVKTDGRFLREELITTEKIEKVKKLKAIADKRGESLSTLALNWVLKDDEITSVLIGVSKASQIIDNLKILNSAPLTKEEINEIESI